VSNSLRTAVCVYCGSSDGANPVYRNAAKELGRSLASNGFELVYGGSSVGLMGSLADAALQAGGRVIGVRPNWLFKDEPSHTGLTELHEVSSMHERKRLMVELSDAFVVLPGGFGTFDELLEIVSWAQLGLHHKPILAVDVDGFWTPLFELIQRGERSGFITPREVALLGRVATPAEAVALLTGIFRKQVGSM
jgi:uncharacterized protein (TIGR00730 family)